MSGFVEIEDGEVHQIYVGQAHNIDWRKVVSIYADGYELVLSSTILGRNMAYASYRFTGNNAQEILANWR